MKVRMTNYDCIFLDRDGTLNHDPGYINHIDNFKLFDFTVSALRKLSELGNQFCIVTNQSGVSRGIIKLEDLDVIHNYNNFRIFVLKIVSVATIR